jgi:hypothetical protein
MNANPQARLASASSIVAAIFVLIAALPVMCQGPELPPAGNLDQSHNGGVAAAPISPVEWVNGNANEQHSHYVEGESIPYRLVMTDLPPGSAIVVVLGYDTLHSSRHAIDYLTHFQRINETVDPLRDVDGVGNNPPAPVGPTTTLPIPQPANSPFGSPVTCMGGSVPQPTTSFAALPGAEKSMTLYGGQLTQIDYFGDVLGTIPWQDVPDGGGAAETRIRVQFTVNPGSTTAVLAWGGHISSFLEWGCPGAPQSAGGIMGSPFHTRKVDWSLGNFGNEDRSLSASAVLAPLTMTCPPPQAATCVFPVNSGACVTFPDPVPAGGLPPYTVTYFPPLDTTTPCPAPPAGFTSAFFTPGTTNETVTVTDSAIPPHTTTCTFPVSVTGCQPTPAPCVTNLGGGCGDSQVPPALLAYLTPLGGLSLVINSAPPNAQGLLAVQPPPFAPPGPLAPPCVLFVDPASPTLLVGYFTTDALGTWSTSSPMPPAPFDLRFQAGTVSPGGPLGTVQLTNALEIVSEPCTLPCTHTREEYAALGPAADLIIQHWLTVFPNGMDVGIYDPVNGSAAPNGFRWTGAAGGRNALMLFLASLPPAGSATNQIIGQDLLDPVDSVGAVMGSGSFQRYVAVLQLNIGFSTAGLLGTPSDIYGSLVYHEPGDFFDGQTVSYILDVCNQVASGMMPVPAGYTLNTLTGLLEMLSLAFVDCTPSPWASVYLGMPAP